MLPKELQTTINTRLNCPCEARNPAKGMTSSDGTGKTMLSSTIIKKMPTYPSEDIIERIKVPIVTKNSDIIDTTHQRKIRYLYFFIFSYRKLETLFEPLGSINGWQNTKTCDN